jgi:hypothetical protein
MDCGRMIVSYALLAALLAACGSDSEPRAAGGGPEAGEMSQVPPPTTGRPSRPPARPTDQLTPRTVRGHLARPTPDCLVVEAANGPWALVGDVPAGLAAGTEIEATGRPAPEVDTGCGYPTLRVISVRRL